MILVIADDITGAAEIAGVAHRYGLQTVLTTSASADIAGADVVVIATDARSYDAATAAEMTREALRPYAQMVDDGKALLFRKTDSALRGNVAEELAALGGNFVYMPANPSKGRIIRDGVYYIRTADEAHRGEAGTPLHETDFRFDPEFPAWSSRLDERFPGMEYANAENTDDVRRVVAEALSVGKRLAGAADLFEALLMAWPETAAKCVMPQAATGGGGTLRQLLDKSCILVCGSTQSKALAIDIPVETMPLDVFYEESAPCTWAAAIITRYRREQSCLLTIGDKEVRKGKAAAVYLRTAMAEVCCTLLAAHEPEELIIEGGATAYAILSQTPYSSFTITDEFAPGVVRMRTATGLHVTMKPGSYSWG